MVLNFHRKSFYRQKYLWMKFFPSQNILKIIFEVIPFYKLTTGYSKVVLQKTQQQNPPSIFELLGINCCFLLFCFSFENQFLKTDFKNYLTKYVPKNQKNRIKTVQYQTAFLFRERERGAKPLCIALVVF